MGNKIRSRDRDSFDFQDGVTIRGTDLESMFKDGDTGPQGIQGIQGVQGPQGIQGIQGPIGLPGATVTLDGINTTPSNQKLAYTTGTVNNPGGAWGKVVVYNTTNTQTYGVRVDRADYADTCANFSGVSSGTNTGDQTDIVGNSGTTTKLKTAINIANVSFNGSANIDIPYANLTGLPSLGTSAAKNIAATGNATTAQVVMGNDTRLTDTRVANGGNASTVTTNANLTGVVTSVGNVTSIADDAITNAMIANSAVTNLSGVNTGDQTNITGNAATATRLATVRTINGVAFDGTGNITINAIDSTARVASSALAAPSGVATLDAAGKVLSSQLPSYVDDVLEYANLASFPVTGESGKIYVAINTNKQYRWSGSVYVYITSGAVDMVAGKTGVVVLVKTDVGLGNVDNTADSTKSVSYANSSGSSNLVVSSDGDRLANTKLPTSNSMAVRYDFVSAVSAGTSGLYAGLMTYAPHNGTTVSTGGASYQMAFGGTAANATGMPKINIRNGIDNTWNSWYTLVHSGNIGTFSSQANDVYAWAKAATKPSYTGNEISASRDTASTDIVTAKELRWKNYGNTHTIIDASAGTSPSGSAISNSNASDQWRPSYPTLMGWNGVSTYGVRVNSSENADKLAASVEIGGTAFNGTVNIVPKYIADDKYKRIVNPPGGVFGDQIATQTGAIKVELPPGMVNTMLRMTIKIYEYATNESFEINCGGYTYSNGNSWANHPFAYIVGNSAINRNFTVRFGYSATGHAVIYIGELTSSWSYPQIHVTDVQVGYSGYDAGQYLLDKLWKVGFEVIAFENITATVSDSQVGYVISPVQASAISAAQSAAILASAPIGHVGTGSTAHAAVSTVSNGFMIATDKSKLDGIAAGAQVNVATNVSEGTRTATTVPVLSSTGTDATLSAATQALAGVMTAADKLKLDNINNGGTATYANLLSSNVVGTSCLTVFQNTTAGCVSTRECNSWGDAPNGGWWVIQSIRHTNASNYWGTQIAYGWEDNANAIYQRNVTAGTWSAWTRVDVSATNITELINNAGFITASASISGSAASLTGPANVNGSDGWFRSTGAAGWYSSTYSVGIYATEAGNVRTYNGANFISSGTVSGTNLSGNNTGDETLASIKTKLGISTLSGTNTGDQVIPTSLPASDVYAWAKAATKPTYSANEVGASSIYSWIPGAVGEVGRYLDMHGGTGAGTDYDVRIDCGPGTGGAGGGTLTVTAAGGITSSGDVTAFSDERLKKDWLALQPDFLTNIAKVKYGTYTRTDTNRKQAGVSAQDMRNILPEAVIENTDIDKTLSVAYGNAALVAVIELTNQFLKYKETTDEEMRLLKEEIRSLKTVK